MIALLVSSTIILFTRKPIARLELEQDRAAARPNRAQTAWAARLYERVNSPEVRLFSLQRWLLSKWEDAYHQLADGGNRIAQNGKPLGMPLPISVLSADIV